MYSRSLLPLIMNFELTIGHTHRCCICGRTFLAYEDGSPCCGASAPTESIIEPVIEQEKKSEEDIWYWMVFDKEAGEISYVHPGDSCSWPRIVEAGDK